MEREEFESKYGKLPSNATYIDLDAQPKPIPEVMTAGWSDTQIRGKTVQELDGMINSAQLGIKNLEETLGGERQRLDDLMRIRNRKIEIGD